MLTDGLMWVYYQQRPLLQTSFNLLTDAISDWLLIMFGIVLQFGLVWVEFNAPPDTVYVISESVFTANHLADTDKQNSIVLQHLFLCYSSCVQSIMGFFYMADVNVFLLSELNSKHIATQIF